MNKRIISLFLALICAISLCACEEFINDIGSDDPVGGDGLEVTFLDVGQADCALLICGGNTLLIDGGNSKDSSLVYSFLREKGVKKLDYIIATHPHEDHVGGISGALSYVRDVGTVYSPVADDSNYYFKRMVRELENMDVKITVPSVGDGFDLGEARATFLGPCELMEDMNQNSLVCKVEYGDISFLFTGDAEKAAEQMMLEAGEDLSATVLKVGHHGSYSSSCYEFLRAVDPSYAVISCERNNDYGHPNDKLLSRLRDADAAICRTDRNGDIVFKTDGTVLTVTAEKGEIGGDNVNAAEAVGGEASGQDQPMYIGNVSSKKYHRPTCSGLPSEKNTVYFYSLEEAVGAGFSPCGMCKP